MSIRPDVVTLLTGLDLTAGAPHDWTHHRDGRPVTPEERDLALSATREELVAVRDYVRRAERYHAERVADFQRVEQLADQYADGLPDGAPMGEIVAQMSEVDRAEFLQIMERLAPDGMLWTPGGAL